MTISVQSERLARALGRTYKLHDGTVVRVVRIDERSVTFAPVEKGVRLINATVSYAEFFLLNLQEC